MNRKMIPYGKQSINKIDLQSVIEVLESDWLTTGPKIAEFEQAFADFVGAKHAIAVNSGTAALHSAMFAMELGPGDEVIVPPITFVSTANCVVFQGATPVFSDVEPGTLLIDPIQVESKISSKTKAIIAVDYAGQPCDYDRLSEICKQNNIALIADACHALGAEYKGCKVGTLADMTCFSFHPVKHITTGEGGMITTDNIEFAERMRRFRNHNISVDSHKRADTGSWFYEIIDLGYNYRITDFQCALGLSQLSRLPGWIERRREIAEYYNDAFTTISGLIPLTLKTENKHAYHLYVIQLKLDELRVGRSEIFSALRADGIGVNVHYIPVHLHPYYKEKFNTNIGLCPVSEDAYERIITLPMFPEMSDRDVKEVIAAVIKTISLYSC